MGNPFTLLILSIAWAVVMPWVGFAEDATNPWEIKIASYNTQLLFDTLDDPYTHDEKRTAKTAESVEAVAKVIQGIHADILVLQEVESFGWLNQFNYTHLGKCHYTQIILLPGNDYVGLNNALLSTKSIVSATSHSSRSFQDEDGNPRSFARDFPWIQIQLPNQETLFVGVMHLKSQVGNQKEVMLWRAAEAKEITRIVGSILSLRAENEPLWCLIGDVNDEPNSKTLSILIQANPEIGYPGSINLSDFVKTPSYTYSSKKPKKQLDYLLVSKALFHHYKKDSFTVLPTSHGLQLASDHLPIEATFIWE